MCADRHDFVPPGSPPAGPAAPGGDTAGSGIAGSGTAPDGSATGAARLINPQVRDYMDALSLQRFYGGYVITALPERLLNLGIGEVGNIALEPDLYTLYRRFHEQQGEETLATRYSGTMGQKETNEQVARWANAWLGEPRFSADLVVSMDGGQNAVEAAVRVFTSPLGSARSQKQYVLLATPSYPYFSMVVAAQAGIQTFLAYDGEQVTQGIERYCNPKAGAILINVPQNPMGYALTAGQAERINRVARAYDCAIVVDMVYANYAPSPDIGRAIARLDPQRTVLADSFSKKYGLPGLRVGFVLSAEPELTYALRFIKMAESLTPSSLKLRFAGLLLRDHGDYPRRIAEQVRARSEGFLERFRSQGAPGVKPIGERNNPFYLALDISALIARTGMSDVEITQTLQHRHEVRVFPGSFVYPGAGLNHGRFAEVGRAAGTRELGMGVPFQPPQVPDAPIVYSQDCAEARVPLLRLSFGTETRIEQAADRLAHAFTELWQGAGR